jgi:hypothetical protein
MAITSTTQQGVPESTEPAKEPARNEIFHVLRNQRRRFTIHHLKRAQEPVEIGDLATQIAAWENDLDTVEVTSQQRRRVYNALQQTHIPLLDRTGLARIDRHEIELTSHAEKLDLYLEVVPNGDVPWSEYYLGLGSVGLAALVVVWLDIGPFALLPDIAAGVFLAIALLVSATANYYYTHTSLLGSAEKPPELRGDA